ALGWSATAGRDRAGAGDGAGGAAPRRADVGAGSAPRRGGAGGDRGSRGGWADDGDRHARDRLRASRGESRRRPRGRPDRRAWNAGGGDRAAAGGGDE